MSFVSPLRYPGGKRKLAGLVHQITIENGLETSMFVEPYAGGAAVALHFLLTTDTQLVWINDYDRSIFSFWEAVRTSSDELCRRIYDTKLDVAEWERQRDVQMSSDPDLPDLAFSTFYLNRTNRAGILLGGLIGGKTQKGKYSMGARFNRGNLIARIERIAKEAHRMRTTCLDAIDLLTALQIENKEAFVFLDPPYYHKARRLYRNDYTPSDHKIVAETLESLPNPWLLTYDDCAEIRELYSAFQLAFYGISYTAGIKRTGAELIVGSEGLTLPRHSPTSCSIRLLPATPPAPPSAAAAPGGSGSAP